MALAAVAFALLASSASRGLASARERSATGELLQVLRQARGQALAGQHQVSVRFDLAARCYQADGQPRRCLAARQQWTLQTLAGQAPEIVFHADGSSSGGNVRLNSGGREVRIDVSWLTGMASLRQAAP